MQKKRILIDSDIPYINGILEPYFEVSYKKGIETCSKDVAGCSVLIVRTRTKCCAELLNNSKVEFIGTTTIGTDHIDKHYCQSSGIETVSAAGCNAKAVVQWVVAAITQFDKKIHFEPSQTTIGVIGVGSVGSRVASTLESMGFRVIVSDPPRAAKEQEFQIFDTPLEHLLSHSDIITLHTPLTTSGEHPTLNIINSQNIGTIKQGATIINAARGGVIDEDALKGAIAAGHIAQVAIDTWSGEPNIDKQLLDIADISTPHIAGYSSQGKANATAMIVRAVAKQYKIAALVNWYPDGVTTTPTNIEMNWANIRRLMPLYYDIMADSKSLKLSAECFEQLRNGYQYRNEFF